MSIKYPESLDSFINPTPNERLNNPAHNLQHGDANDAIRALQIKVGIDGSADTNSLDYKFSNLVDDIASIADPAGTAQTLVDAEADTRAAADTSLAETVARLSATAWQANTAYPAESIVTEGVGLYQAPSGGVPSRSTFTADDWIHLGDIALPVGTTSGTVAAGDDPRIVGAASAINLAAEVTRAETAEATKPNYITVGSPVTSNGTLTINQLTPVNATSGALTMTLPTGHALSWLVVQKTDSSAHNITLSGSIRGSSSTLLLQMQNETLWLVADSSGSWYPLASDKTLASLDARYDSSGSATSAVAAETTRAETAEALALQISNNLSDLNSASTARTNLGLGTAATHATTDFDAAGSASSAITAAESFTTSAVATETSRAETAEAAALQKSNNLSDLTSAATARSSLGLTTGQLFLSGAGMWPSITNGCGINTQTQTTTNLQNIYTLSFADAATSSAEATLTMPWDWNAGTITASFYWIANDTTTHVVVWGIQGYAYSDGVTLDESWGTQQTVSDANNSTANQLRVSSATSAITLGGTPTSASMVQFRVQRLGSNGSDTLTANAQLLGVLITYTKS